MKKSIIYKIFLNGMMLLFLSTGTQAQWVKTSIDSSIVGGRCFTTCSNKSGGTNLFIGTKGGVYLSTNNGSTWNLQDGGDYGFYNVTSLVGLDTNIIAVQGANEILVSSNYGASWNYCVSFENSFTLAANGTDIFLGVWDHGIYLSTDIGTTWHQKDNGLANYTVLSFAFMGSTVFAGTEGGVFKSTDNGYSWTAVNSGLPNTTFSGILNVTILAASGNNLFAEVNDSVYLSTNNGSSWNVLTNISSVNSLTAINNNLFAGTDSGVYLSTDNGISWITANVGLTNTKVVSLAIMGMNIFAQTSDNYVWMRPLSELITAVKGNEAQIPAQFKLDQNYPNPFNPKTTINYSIPKASLVMLKVYDVLGKEVATLIDEEKSAGNYHIQFNANTLSSGVYFYRLSAENSVMTKKLIIMK
jgi:hypothetical protein